VANYATGVNSEILQWAREKAGYSLDEVARSLKKDTETIVRWESGDAFPTYHQLERLAYSLYKRPIALFFFPRPPEEPDPRESFRTLPDSEFELLVPDTLHAIREAQAMQITLYELTEGRNPSDRVIFRDLALDPHADAIERAAVVREYLGISLDEQYSWESPEQALEKWRDAVQDAGIFVFKRAMKQKDVSGFCLLDEEFPLIYLNNSTAKTRQLFSLFHELAHILLGTAGVTKVDDRYVFRLTGQSKAVEVFCNRFSAELLVPSDDFDQRLVPAIPVENLVDALASHYGVSREVILRKLLDRGIVDQGYYEHMVQKWLDSYQEKEDKGAGGGNYYANQYVYLGQRYLTLAFARYYDGAYSIHELADYLSIRTKNVPGLEHYFLSRASV
jgi:Zn-dependent peptidase ImmA (M78 family)/DNA-binding XRE family transcriptional regulator